ncbi:MAG TPA: hypothetical protein VGB30_13525 [bacterium]
MAVISGDASSASSYTAVNPAVPPEDSSIGVTQIVEAESIFQLAPHPWKLSKS